MIWSLEEMWRLRKATFIQLKGAGCTYLVYLHENCSDAITSAEQRKRQDYKRTRDNVGRRPVQQKTWPMPRVSLLPLRLIKKVIQSRLEIAELELIIIIIITITIISKFLGHSTANSRCRSSSSLLCFLALLSLEFIHPLRSLSRNSFNMHR